MAKRRKLSEGERERRKRERARAEKGQYFAHNKLGMRVDTKAQQYLKPSELRRLRANKQKKAKVISEIKRIVIDGHGRPDEAISLLVGQQQLISTRTFWRYFNELTKDANPSDS